MTKKIKCEKIKNGVMITDKCTFNASDNLTIAKEHLPKTLNKKIGSRRLRNIMRHN